MARLGGGGHRLNSALWLTSRRLDAGLRFRSTSLGSGRKLRPRVRARGDENRHSMAIDRITLCVAISSIISTISLIEKSGMEVGVVEWMSSPFQRYIKYPALIACAIIFILPGWGKQTKEEATEQGDDGEGGKGESSAGESVARATQAGSRGTTSSSIVGGGGGGSKKKRAKAMRGR